MRSLGRTASGAFEREEVDLAAGERFRGGCAARARRGVLSTVVERQARTRLIISKVALAAVGGHESGGIRLSDAGEKQECARQIPHRRTTVTMNRSRATVSAAFGENALGRCVSRSVARTTLLLSSIRDGILKRKYARRPGRPPTRITFGGGAGGGFATTR